MTRSMAKDSVFFVAYWASQGARLVKNPSASAGDTRDAVSILGREDPLEEEMATHCNILAWEILWTCVQSNCVFPIKHVRILDLLD